MKVKLVLKSGEHNSFTSGYLQSIWSRYFEISNYDSDTVYSKSNTLFVTDQSNANSEYVKQLQDQGYRVVIDNLWEFASSRTDYYWLQNPNWYWYNESLWYSSLRLENGFTYDQYQPNKKYSKLSLMPIRRPSEIRDYIVDKLGARLDNFIWSYRDRHLPDDMSWDNADYQRFFRPEWYNDTYFSTVVETFQKGRCKWLTEKIFKPCAYYHPFVVIGQSHTLTRLQQLGFETYENLFDESYDTISDFYQRFDTVIKTIDNFDPTPYDSITLGKLQHNHDHFFNQALVESRIISEIVEPLLHHAET